MARCKIKLFANPGHESESTGGSLYWNRKSGVCYYGQYGLGISCGFTLTGLNDTAKSMIGDAKWYLGGISTYYGVMPPMFYQRERGTTVYSGRSKNWIGKVGLMYPSDYGYATSGGSTTNRDICLETSPASWNYYSNCYNNDWLLHDLTQWTMSPSADTSYDASFASSAGYLYYDRAYNPNKGIFPVVHLKSTIKITSGTGSSTDSFILG